MAKEYNLGAVEYAYVTHINVSLNSKSVSGSVSTYHVNVVIAYELLGAGKNLLLNKSVNHEVSQVGSPYSVAELTEVINANLNAWVLADKRELSGYIPN